MRAGWLIDRLLAAVIAAGIWALVSQAGQLKEHLYEIQLHMLDLKNAAWAQANKPAP